MMRVHHPLPGLINEVSPTARFTGFPPAAAPSGAVVADDQTHRFLAVLDGFPHNRWHRDIDRSVGVPSVDRGMIFIGAGGAGATRGIMALDAGTGAPAWVYSPEGLAADPQRMRATQVAKTITVIKNHGRAREPRASGVPQTAGFGTRAGQVELEDKQIPVNVPQPNSALPAGHLTNPGLVIAGGRIYGEVNRTIVALDQRTGSPVWRHPLTARSVVHSLVATRDHLLLCMSNTPKGERIAPWEVRSEAETDDFLIALRMDNGKRVWEEPVALPGTLSLSNGLVYFANGDLHVLGPAERTYQLAANSDRSEDYRPKTVNQLASVPTECMPMADAPEGEPEAPHVAVPPRADASILRLEYGRPIADLLRQIRTRRAAIGSAPLLISLDWLTPDRGAVRGGGVFNAAWVKQYGSVVEELATAGRPEHFDVAPEVNVYLSRHPEQLEAVRSLIRTAAAMARDGAPHTSVLVSFNVETLAGLYGRNTVQPFGLLPKLRKDDALATLTLLREVTAVGLTTYPQAGYLTADLMPTEYMLTIKRYLQQKPLLFTGVTVRVDGKTPREVAAQTAFLPRMMQQLYWLDAKLVAKPDIQYTESPAWPKDLKYKPLDLVAPALSGWETLPRWERVSRLSVTLPETESPPLVVQPNHLTR